ncbi:MAG: hypothetical protein NC339_06730 [Muribaculaceae bacterium]|nr:hypothetical protein [Muribaculaceae bacterium]
MSDYNNHIESGEYTSEGIQEYCWSLAVAYLKLLKKGDAIKVLENIVRHDEGSPLAHHCAMLLKQLD